MSHDEQPSNHPHDSSDPSEDASGGHGGAEGSDSLRGQHGRSTGRSGTQYPSWIIAHKEPYNKRHFDP